MLGTSAISNPQNVLAQQGWVLMEPALDPQFINSLIVELESAYARCREIQLQNGIGKDTPGTAHHLPAFKGAFIQLLQDLPYQTLIQDYFNAPFILNSFGGVLNNGQDNSYVGRVHRDIRFYTGDLPLMLNMLIMLDEFTLENGATYVLSGSHRQLEKPEDALFYKQADRVCGMPGSCLFFNSNLWHAAGVNHTDLPRRALTLTWTRSCMKPQIDYVQLLGESFVSSLEESTKQILGYHARTPASLEAWYLPPESRFYRPGQD